MINLHSPIRSLVILAAGLTLISVAVPISRAEDESPNIEQGMSPEEFHAAGLDKLSPAELGKLNAWLRGDREKTMKKAAARVERTRMPLIVSRIDGIYNGVVPGEIIRLEDGSAWKLANKDEHYGGYADHPAVAVVKSFMGWKMRISRLAEFYVLPVKTP